MIYQEQVMQAAQALAGYTLGGADLLRRAMGKKKAEEMAKQREIFVKGCAKVNHIPAAKANQIFDLLEKFAGYGFNKSHAAAYAIVAYQTAYLKANYPVEFFCAMMTNDMADTEKLSQYIARRAAWASRSCRRMSTRARCISRRPDRERQHPCRRVPAAPRPPARMPALPVGHPLRPGGDQGRRRNRGRSDPESAPGRRRLPHAGRPVRARGRAHGQPQGPGGADQVRRLRLPWPDARDPLRADRPHAGARGEHHRGPAARPGSLFGALEERLPQGPDSGLNLPEWPEHELLAHEKELLGFYVTGHPLTRYAPILEKYALANTGALGAIAAPQPHPHRRADRGGAERRLQEDRQAVSPWSPWRTWKARCRCFA